jgi:hypothetical protein
VPAAELGAVRPLFSAVFRAMKKAFDIAFGIVLLGCGLFALQMGSFWWGLHDAFAGSASYSPVMFLLFFAGTLLAVSGLCLPFIPQKAGVVGAVTLITAAAIGFFQLPKWQFPVGFLVVALVTYLRFIRRSTFHRA